MEIKEENPLDLFMLFLHETQMCLKDLKKKKKIIFFGLNAKCTPVFIIRTQHVSPEKIEFDFKFSLVGGVFTKRKKKMFYDY
jgi:hypothetical protein